MSASIPKFRSHVLPDVIGCPAHIVDQAVISSIIQLCKDATLLQKSFEHSVDASIDVDTADNDSITIDITDYLGTAYRPYTVQELKIDGTKWETSLLELETDVDDLSLYEIASTKFFNFPDTDSIKIYPMETDVDVLVYLKLALLPFETMTSIDDTVYDNHYEAVASYAKWLLMRQPNKQWTDIKLADYHFYQYSCKMEEGKIHQLMGFTFGSLRPRSRRFF